MTVLTVFLVWRLWTDILMVPGATSQPPAHYDMHPTALLFQTSAECHAARLGETLAVPPAGYKEPECRPEALEVKP